MMYKLLCKAVITTKLPKLNIKQALMPRCRMRKVYNVYLS